MLNEVADRPAFTYFPPLEEGTGDDFKVFSNEVPFGTPPIELTTEQLRETVLQRAVSDRVLRRDQLGPDQGAQALGRPGDTQADIGADTTGTGGVTPGEQNLADLQSFTSKPGPDTEPQAFEAGSTHKGFVQDIFDPDKEPLERPDP